MLDNQNVNGSFLNSEIKRGKMIDYSGNNSDEDDED
jgi:hypothetical protein